MSRDTMQKETLQRETLLNDTLLRDTLLREVGTLSRTVNGINDVKYAPLELHKNQYIFLTRICENKGLSLKTLSIMLKMDKTTTTKAVQKLIKSGYVIKHKDANDQRVAKLYPTEKSLKIYQEIIAEENRAVEICFNGFSDEEKNTVRSLIERMNENLSAEWYETKNYKGEIDD